MKNSKKQIETVINEAMKTKLESIIEAAIESFLKEATDSKAAYEHMKELEKGHRTDFWILESVGPEVYEEILRLRDEAEDYSAFYSAVGPGKYDREKGSHKSTNKFGMRAELAKAIYDKKIASLPVEELIKLQKEWNQLKNRFKEVVASDEADKAYGRKRVKVIDTKTGETIDSFTNRAGSLGS